MKRLIGTAVILAGPILIGVAVSAVDRKPQNQAQPKPVDYVSQIKPILVKHCYRCHGPKKQESGLRLDTVAAVLRGGDNGRAIIPGKGAASTLYQVLIGKGDISAMPAEGPKLSADQIAIIKRWIDEGAHRPKNETADTGRRRSSHWAFQPIRRLRPPVVRNRSWVRNGIDAYILARLEKERLAPSLPANRQTLIRRLSLDLRGVLPSLSEVDQFLRDRQSGAYERLVDRFLSSPQYGERWGRHWLDLARYADSNGFTIDGARSIWKYRDWVIDAVNRDLPFDRFTIEQIAGDLLPHATAEQLIATGFHRNTLINQEGGTDKEQFRVEAVVDRVNTTGSVFLGLTVGCAHCHSHKFDPISQREYFQMFAFFNNCDEPKLSLPTLEQAARLKKLNTRLTAAKSSLQKRDAALIPQQSQWERAHTVPSTTAVPVKAIRPDKPLKKGAIGSSSASATNKIRQILAIPRAKWNKAQAAAIRTAFLNSDPARKKLAADLAAISKRRTALTKSIPTTMILRERRRNARTTHIHIRGDFLSKGPVVHADVPAVLPVLRKSGKTGNRLDFARWLVDPRNPLTPRVTVNRFWQRFFGRGLVATEDDFGTQGNPPTHPKLLDWLAAEFVRRGWSMKSIQRLIVTSATYRQSSRMRPDLLRRDRYNRLLARQSRLRIDAEIVRDVCLSVSGLLSRKMNGPGIYPPQPKGIYALTQIKKAWPESKGPDRYRRGLYTYFWRSAPYPFLVTFDAPESNTTCTRRSRSNTPLQALTLANDRAFIEMARELAARILREGPADTSGRIQFGFQVCFSREPTQLERETLTRFVNDQQNRFRRSTKQARAAAMKNLPKHILPTEAATWTALARVLINLDEFITRE